MSVPVNEFVLSIYNIKQKENLENIVQKKIILGQGLANLFYKGAVSKRFQLCGSYRFCHNDSTLPLPWKNKHDNM
jgi:hypothetical protein